MVKKEHVLVSDGHLRPCLDPGKAKCSLMDWDTVHSSMSWDFARQNLAGGHFKASGFPGVVLVFVGSLTLLFYMLLR